MSSGFEPPFANDVVRVFQLVIDIRRQPDESVDDVFAGGMFLAERRARAFERAVWPIDLEAMLSLFCFWFKPDLPPRTTPQLIAARGNLFRGASSGRIDALESAVPDRTLLLPIERIHQVQVEGQALELLDLRGRPRFA
jgi:hypothetical protein